MKHSSHDTLSTVVVAKADDKRWSSGQKVSGLISSPYHLSVQGLCKILNPNLSHVAEWICIVFVFVDFSQLIMKIIGSSPTWLACSVSTKCGSWQKNIYDLSYFRWNNEMMLQVPSSNATKISSSLQLQNLLLSSPLSLFWALCHSCTLSLIATNQRLSYPRAPFHEGSFSWLLRKRSFWAALRSWPLSRDFILSGKNLFSHRVNHWGIQPSLFTYMHIEKQKLSEAQPCWPRHSRISTRSAIIIEIVAKSVCRW